MIKDLWEALIDAAEAGKTVQVSLLPGSEIKPAGRLKRPSGGRPRILGAARWSHYEGWNPAFENRRPRCQAPRCHKHLRKGQRLGCSEFHAQLALQALAGLTERARPK